MNVLDEVIPPSQWEHPGSTCGESQTPAPPRPSELTLGDYATAWAGNIRARLDAGDIKPSTARHYLADLEHHVLPAFGSWSFRWLNAGASDRDADRIVRRREIHEQIDFWIARGRREAAGLTVRNYTRVARALLASACRDGHALWNPFEGKVEQHSLSKRASTAIRAMEQEQLDRFLEAAHDLRPDLFPHFATYALTGMRRGELVPLERADVDLERRYIRVGKSLWLRGSIVDARPDRPKTDSGIRYVMIRSQLAAILAEHLASHDSELAFPNPSKMAAYRGGYTHPSMLSRVMKSILEHAGLPSYFRLHDLRHTRASLDLIGGRNLNAVASDLGHANPSITLSIYGRWLKPHDWNVIETLQSRALGDFLRPAA